MGWQNLKQAKKPKDCGQLVDVELIRPPGQKMLKRNPSHVDWGNVKMWKDG